MKQDKINFNDPKWADIIKKQNLENVTYEDLIARKNKRIKEYCEKSGMLQDANLRHWLKRHKAKHMIDFDDKERQQLKQYFNSLDKDGSKSIGIDELELPLISLGIAESQDDVEKLVYSVDDDGSIQFQEFLDIIKNKNGDAKNNPKENIVIDFFKGTTILNMINGRLGKDSGQPINKNLPFNLIINTIRRQKLLDALMANDPKRKEDGERVLKAYRKYNAKKDIRKNDTQSEITK